MAQKRKKLGTTDDVRNTKSKFEKPASGPATPSLYCSTSHRPDGFVKIKDLQQLVLYLLTNNDETPPAPRWIAVRNLRQFESVVVLYVPGFTKELFFPDEIPVDSSSPVTKKQIPGPDDYYPRAFDLDTAPTALRPLTKIFSHVWPVRAAGDAKYAKFVSPVYTMLSSSVPKDIKAKSGSSHKQKRTPITRYLASEADLETNNYVMHPAYYAEPPLLPPGWVSSNVKSLDDAKELDAHAESGSMTLGRNVISIDCEMCSTGDHELALTRISILDWNDEIVLDELVKPDRPIIDYLTQYSGITEAMLENVTTTLADIQQKLLGIVTPTTIIAGHSLESDFQALKFTHPFVVDTSLIYPHPKGIPYKQSLKYITKQYIKRDIQQQHGAGGHDSIEDARAVMDLVRQKCERGPDYGVPDMAEPIVQRLSRDAVDPRAFHSCTIDWKAARNAYVALADQSVECAGDAEVVESIKEALCSHASSSASHDAETFDESTKDGAVAAKPKSPAFLWASLHDVERARGWFRGGDAQNAEKTQRSGPAREGSHPTAHTPELDAAVQESAGRIASIYEALPPKTALIVYSGLSDTSEVNRYSQMYRQFQEEFKTKKWDELSVQWTTVEDDAKRAAFRKATEGIGMLAVRN